MADPLNASNAAPIKGPERGKKFDRAKKDEYLGLLREGIRRGQAAQKVGVNPCTVQRHMQRYPSFTEEVSQAEMLANEEVENALYTAAVSGNVTACQVWLYNRLPDTWADRRNIKAEISGKDGGPIQTDMKVILDALNDPEARDALDALSRRLESQPSGDSG